MEVGVDLPDHQLPLFLLVQPGLLSPQWQHKTAAWLTARPQPWFTHHHQAWAAPGGGGVRRALLGAGAGPDDALPPPVAVLLALVPVFLPGPEGDLLLFFVASGAVTGVWLPLALASRVLDVPGSVGRDMRGWGINDHLAVLVVLLGLSEPGPACRGVWPLTPCT